MIQSQNLRNWNVFILDSRDVATDLVKAEVG